MITIIWLFLFITGSLTFIISGNVSSLNINYISSINNSFELLSKILPGIILWSGVMKVAEESGILNKLSNILMPVLKKLFPTVPKESKALDYISFNIAANAMGLGSVATPFGLKAMKELQKLNKNKKEASYAMRTFLVINTAGVTIIPTMVITLRISYKSINPFCILIPSIIITLISCILGIVINHFWRR